MLEVAVKFKVEKILCMFLSRTKHPFESNKISCPKTVSYPYLKMERLISGARLGSWFLINVSRCAHYLTMVLACIQKKLCTKISNFFSLSVRFMWSSGVFYMNLYVCSKGRNFKAFLKENDAITVGSCYLFTKKMLKTELNLILILLMRFGNIRHSWSLQQIWWIPCNLSRWRIWFGLLVCNTLRFFFYLFFDFSQKSMTPDYWEHWNKVRH